MIIDGQAEAYVSAGSFIESGAHRAIVLAAPEPPAAPAPSGGFAGVGETPLFVLDDRLPIGIHGDVRAAAHRVRARATVSARRQATGAVAAAPFRLQARLKIRPTGEDDWILGLTDLE